MARKINLKGLHDNGDLTVTKFNITEDATSDGVSALFDGDTSVLRFQANQHGISSFKEQLKLDFSSNIKGRKFRVRITTGVTDDINLHVNGKVSNLQSISGLGSATTIHTNSFDFSVNSLSQIRISLGNSFSNGDHEVYEIELFIMEEANPYEFNDSVLTTKAWNSSRYDGRQLSGSKINKYVFGDVTYGLTPVVRNLTRTFYISSDITSLGNTGLKIDKESGDEIDDLENPIEDPSLQHIPDFSYVIINKSVTVNQDNSITVTDVSTFNSSPDSIDRKIGFDREFQTNIPIGSFVGIKNLDADIKDRSNTSYPVYFNQGRLQPVLRTISFGIGGLVGSAISVPNKDNQRIMVTSFNPFATVDGSVTSINPINKTLLSSISTSSLLERTPIVGGNFSGYNFVGGDLMDDFLFAFNNQTAKKGFMTLLSTPDGSGGSENGFGTDISATAPIPPIRTITPSSISGSFEASELHNSTLLTPGFTQRSTKNLAELSTAQFGSYTASLDGQGETILRAITASAQFSFNQNYQTPTMDNTASYTPNYSDVINIHPEGDAHPRNFSGSYDFSILNEEKPALLLNLIKKVEFPEGIGRTPLVIIPETLHPFVKDNIPQFMAQAGFDIGDITQINTLDETNQTLS